MSLFGRMGNETVTVLRRSQPDSPIGEKPDPDVTFDIEDCAVWPNTVTEKVSSATGVEKVDGQFTVLSGMTVFAPPGSDVKPTDQMVVRGVTYQVNGLPSVWNSPLTGTKSGIEIQLKGATG